MLTVFKQDTDELILENVSDKIVNYICGLCPGVTVNVSEAFPHKTQVRTINFTNDYVIQYDSKLMILSTVHKIRLFVVI